MCKCSKIVDGHYSWKSHGLIRFYTSLFSLELSNNIIRQALASIYRNNPWQRQTGISAILLKNKLNL